ncbi:MAG: hypothetical protein IJ004_04490 [Clostridia bacterium]|nr:hypothetical protein [Clostridia bacterium]
MDNNYVKMCVPLQMALAHNACAFKEFLNMDIPSQNRFINQANTLGSVAEINYLVKELGKKKSGN